MSFKSSEQKTTGSQSSTTTPWDPQAGYLTQAFQDASNAYDKASGATGPGQYTAQYTPDQLSAFQKMLDFGMGGASGAAGATAAGNTLTGAGANASTSGLGVLSGFTPGSIADNNIAAANKYVAGQDIPGQVDAAMLDARRNASENVLPALARSDAATGNINSSKDAISQGLVERGLADKAGALSAQLRGAAYDNGLTLGQQGTNSALTAALGQVTGGNSAVNSGVNAGNSGVAQQTGLFGIANNAINSQVNANQAGLTNQEQQFEHQTNDPFAALMNFYNIIGNRPWGQNTTGTSTSTTESTPSGLQSIIGGVGALGSLFSPIKLPFGGGGVPASPTGAW